MTDDTDVVEAHVEDPDVMSTTEGKIEVIVYVEALPLCAAECGVAATELL
jgi:hypothetical protein